MEGLVVRREERRGPEEVLNLPAGFRFYPTDEELVVHYLCKKAAAQPFAVPIIAEVDLYKFDPWDLPEKALFGEKEWYFFSPRDRKYPNGSRPNRAAGAGYWKATGTDKPITCSSRKVGIKKALVFYKGKPPKGSKTNWIMHEYRLAEPSRKSMNALKCGGTKKASLRMDDWVLCRIYYKKIVGATQKDSAEISTIHNIDSANDDCVGINTEEEQHNRGVSDANNNNNHNNMLNSPPSPKFYANNNASSTSLEECSRDDDSTIDELEQECERHLSMDRNIEEEHHLEFPPNSDSSQNDSLYNTFNVSQEDASMRVLDDTNSCQQLYSNSTLDRLESLLSLIDKGLFGNIGGGGLLNRPL